MDEIRSALSFVPPDDRETWVLMGMAIRDALGDQGFDVWDSWSQQSDRYKAGDARSVWRSFRGRGVTVATLYKLARDNGWKGQGQVVRHTPTVRHDPSEQIRRDQARAKAEKLIAVSLMGNHPYLARKGFPDEQGLVFDQLLVIPMRDMNSSAVNSAQTITWEGEKKFLAGGQAKGSVFALGSGSETWLVEGYATGLSVRAALRSLYRQARVVVCFSAANVAHVAERMGDYVIADHDESGTGQRYAEKAGLPWWMPPEPGDANDWHQAQGVRALAEAMIELRTSSPLCRGSRTAGSGSR